MRKSVGSLAAVVALAISAPVLGQADDDAVSYEVAMDCGIAHAFLGGLLEQDDPDLSGDLVQSATVWLAMAYNRFTGADADYDARIDSQTAQLTEELTDMAGEEEVSAFFTEILRSCEVIRAANADEYEQVAEEIEAEG